VARRVADDDDPLPRDRTPVGRVKPLESHGHEGGSRRALVAEDPDREPPRIDAGGLELQGGSAGVVPGEEAEAHIRAAPERLEELSHSGEDADSGPRLPQLDLEDLDVLLVEPRMR